MLITIPWAVGVFLGRREYDPKTDEARKSKVVNGISLTNQCVTVQKEIPESAIIMMVVTVSYLIIQIPAFAFTKDADNGAVRIAPFALAGLIITFLFFCGYCYFQYSSAMSANIIRLEQQALTLDRWKTTIDKSYLDEQAQKMLFKKYDKDNSGTLTLDEAHAVFKELDLDLSEQQLRELLIDIDTDHSGDVDFNEFRAMFKKWVKEEKKETEKMLTETGQGEHKKKKEGEYHTLALMDDGEVKDEKKELVKKKSAEKTEEEEEEEENFFKMTDSELRLQAIGILLLGTAICTIVSDPMVDTIGGLGKKMGISPFYISFVVTPLASNASEVISGLIFASRKTVESMTLTLATLHGGATMNSTLSLGIFMTLIYARHLAWSYSAEVIVLLIIIVTVGLNSLKKNIFLWQGLLVSCLYPFSIIFIALLKMAGLD
jgi:Ca2+/Na+ antiporter